jgi:Protein of unknown function (DUF1304)
MVSGRGAQRTPQRTAARSLKPRADVRMWAFVVGFRNMLAGIATIVGLVMLRTGDATVGEAVVLTAACYMLLASLPMGIADLLGFWRPRGGLVFWIFNRALIRTNLAFCGRQRDRYHGHVRVYRSQRNAP